MAGKERHQGEENKKQPPRRVVFEQQDGTVIYLDGGEAIKWSKVMDDLVMNGFIHGVGQSELGSIQWKRAASLKDVPQIEEENNDSQSAKTMNKAL